MCLTPAARERTHRRVDEAVTAGVEVFLAEREGLDQVFTTAELARAISIARFTERDAQLFVVALMGQGGPITTAPAGIWVPRHLGKDRLQRDGKRRDR